MIAAVFVVLAIFQFLLCPFVQAEIFYDQDGIQLQGSARVVRYNAYTCNVLEEKHSEKEYEKRKVNQDRPLHMWQIDYSVYNGSGRALEHLRAQLDIESDWPPCDNWDETPDSDFREFFFWTGGWQIIQMPNGMRPHQAERRRYIFWHSTRRSLGLRVGHPLQL